MPSIVVPIPLPQPSVLITAVTAGTAQVLFVVPYDGRSRTPLHLGEVTVSNSTAASRVQVHVGILKSGASLPITNPFMSPILQAGEFNVWDQGRELEAGDSVVAWADNASRGVTTILIGRIQPRQL